MTFARKVLTFQTEAFKQRKQSVKWRFPLEKYRQTIFKYCSLNLNPDTGCYTQLISSKYGLYIAFRAIPANCNYGAKTYSDTIEENSI